MGPRHFCLGGTLFPPKIITIKKTQPYILQLYWYKADIIQAGLKIKAFSSTLNLVFLLI